MPRTAGLISAACLVIAMLAAALQPGHAQGENTLFLPVVRKNPPTIPNGTLLGARLLEETPTHNPWQPYLVNDAVYALDVYWYKVETSPGVYDWSTLDAGVAALQGTNSRLLITIKTSPEWARAFVLYPSSRPVEAYYDDYARFVNMVIDRTGAWGVELWNEPAMKCYAGILENYGCWLFPTEEPLTNQMFFDGGVQYGYMLRTAVPIIRSAHPNVKIVIGALAGYSLGGQQSVFVQGVQSIGFQGADYISFHIYMQSDNVRDLQIAYYDLTFQTTARLHADTGLPVIISETSIRTPGMNDNKLRPSDQFLRDQDEYLRRLLDTLPAHPEVRMILWFSLAGVGFENTDLIQNYGVGLAKYKPVYCTWASVLGHPDACPVGLAPEFQ